ncbi:MAG: YkgJ family cysteine cluster protein [Halobacteriota archaeon]|nr:YkgJ family cysteine cluster protein [Halobacteriota archaeon]
MEKEKPKFVFHCQRCGRCCERKEEIVILINDIKRWSDEGVIYQVFPHISIVERCQKLSIRMNLEDGVCEMYDKEKKECTIYSSRPITCRSFPLRFNGNNYFIKDKECPGLSSESMSAEELTEIREAAKGEHVGEGQMMSVLPVLHSLILKEVTEKSKEVYENLTDEEKEKLEEMFKEV